MTTDIPDTVGDLMLWRAAQAVLERHRPVRPAAEPDFCCAHCRCPWPCRPAHLAHEAQRLACRAYPSPTPSHRSAPVRRPAW